MYGDRYLPFEFKDVDSLNFLKGKFPQSPIVFVCNKIDTLKQAQPFDSRDGDEDGSDEDDHEDDNGHGQSHNSGDKRDVGKEETVFYQLKSKFSKAPVVVPVLSSNYVKFPANAPLCPGRGGAGVYID